MRGARRHVRGDILGPHLPLTLLGATQDSEGPDPASTVWRRKGARFFGQVQDAKSFGVDIASLGGRGETSKV